MQLLSQATARLAGSRHTRSQIVELIADHARQLTQSSVAVCLLSPDGAQLCPSAIRSDSSAMQRRLRQLHCEHPVYVDEHAVLQSVVRNGESCWIAACDPRLRGNASTQPYLAAARALELHGVLLLPLRAPGSVLGVLACARRGVDNLPGREFDAVERTLLTVFADHAGLAIQEAEAREALAAPAAQQIETFEVLRHSELAHRTILSESPLALFVMDVDSEQMLHANRAALELYGYPHDEFLKLRLDDLRYPADREALQALVLAAGAADLSGIARHQRKDGTLIFIEGKGHVAMFEGRRARFVAVQDVSERQRAETELRASEQRLKDALEHMMEGYILLDAQGRHLYLNDTAAARARMPKEQMLGRTPEELFPGFEKTAFYETLKRCRANRTATRLETEFVFPDGRRDWYELSIQPAPNDATLILSIDITERRRAQAELQRSEARFARLAAAGIIGVLVGDLDGGILEANDTCQRMLGYSQHEPLDSKISWHMLTPPEWRSECDQAIAEVKAHGVSGPREREYLRKDGSRVPVLVGLAKLDDTHVIAFMADLTEQKQTERALQEVNEQLRQAQKLEAVGRLAGGVAHDFNNALSVILSYGEMVLTSLNPTDPLRADIEEICKAGMRASDLTRQLLMFSRRQVLAPKVVDLNEILAGMEKMMQRMLGEDVETTFVTEPELGRVRVDPSSIEQVIMNIVVNARDAMPVGGKLTIETANVELDEQFAREHLGVRSGPHVLLAITDTGVGMDKTTRQHIFEPFFTTKEPGRGTGLGLSTVFGIVQQSQGSICVHSELGKGTTFEIYLPRVEAAAEVTGKREPPNMLRGTETILLVEDQDQLRIVARNILRRHGYRVLDARHAIEALQLSQAETGNIHLLLTDVVMPQMSGPELAKRLALARSDMRVLYMSGYTDDNIVRHGVLEAEIAYLQKPITPSSLTRKVREVCDAPRAVQAADA